MRIIIDGPPIAKKRPKCKCVQGHGFVYDPQVKDEMALIKKEIKRQWDYFYSEVDSEYHQEAHLIDRSEAITVILTFYSPIIKSATKAQKNAKLWGLSPNAEKPDIDNLAKLYLDCMTGIIWPDDSMVTKLIATKAGYSEHPYTIIDIYPVKDLKPYLNPSVIAMTKIVAPHEYEEMVNDFGYFIHVLTEGVKFHEKVLENSDSIPRGPAFPTASMLLIEFAKKHVDKLKKIAKIEVK
jgi:Holliday junction resolvase RusA-like endonuclease